MDWGCCVAGGEGEVPSEPYEFAAWQEPRPPEQQRSPEDCLLRVSLEPRMDTEDADSVGW